METVRPVGIFRYTSGIRISNLGRKIRHRAGAPDADIRLRSPTCQDHPLKNAFAIVTLSALLSACAVAPQKQGDSDATPAAVMPAPASAPAVADAPAPEDPAPSVELTSDLMYKITKAELEFKSGQWQGAYI